MVYGSYFLKYADAHLGRILTPLFTLAARGWRQSIQWREVPAALKAIHALCKYTHGEGRGDDPSEQEAQIREGFTQAFGMIIHDEEEGFQVAVDEFISVGVAIASPHQGHDTGPLPCKDVSLPSSAAFAVAHRGLKSPASGL